MIRNVFFILLAAVVGLSGCSGGSGNGGEDSVSGGGAQQQPITISALDVGSSEEWLLEGVSVLGVADADADGVPDDYDVYPGIPAEQAGLGEIPLFIAAVWSEFDSTANESQVVPLAATVGSRLSFRMSGTASDSVVWAVFETENGFVGRRADLVDGFMSDWQVSLPDEPFSQFHLVANHIRSQSVPLQTMQADQPRLYRTLNYVAMDQELTIPGANLAEVTEVLLGDNGLVIVSQSDSELVVRLPAVPSSTELVALTADSQSNRIFLRMRRPVNVRLDVDLPLPLAGSVVTWVDAEEVAIDVAGTVLQLPGVKPYAVYFDAVTLSGERLRNVYAAIVWPDSTEVVVSTESTLLARLLIQQGSSASLYAGNYSAFRADLTRAQNLSVAELYYTALGSAVSTGSLFSIASPELAAVYDAYQSLEMSPAAKFLTGYSFRPQGLFIDDSGPTVTGPGLSNYLDDSVGSTLHITRASKDPFSSSQTNEIVNEATYSYPKPEEVIGSSYSQIDLMPTGRIISTWLGTIGCELSGAPPPDLMPSDLCIRIGGYLYASAAVYLPEKPVSDGPFDFTADRSWLVRKHVEPVGSDSLITNYLGADSKMLGPGSHYLTTDSGHALCKMQTCFVELITSGMGVGYKFNTPSVAPAYDAEYEKIQGELQSRMWLDILVPTILNLGGVSDSAKELLDYDPAGIPCPQCDAEAAGDNPYDDSVNAGNQITGTGVARDAAKKCIVEKLVDKGKLRASAKALAAEFARNKLDPKSPTYAADFFNSVSKHVGKYVDDVVNDQTEDLGKTIFDCAKSLKPVEEFKESIVKQMGTVGKRILFFYEVYEFVSDVGSVVFTPSRILFRMDPRARVTALWDDKIDLYNTADDVFSYAGRWIYEEDDGGGSDHWSHRIVFTDRAGVSGHYNVVDEDVVNRSDFSLREVSIPTSKLSSILNTLDSGPLSVELQIYHEKFENYPDRRLVIPINQKVQHAKRAEIFAINPPSAEPGDTVELYGRGLNSVVVYDNNGVADFNVRFVSLDSDGSLNFDRSGTAVVKGYYEVCQDEDDDKPRPDKDCADVSLGNRIRLEQQRLKVEFPKILTSVPGAYGFAALVDVSDYAENDYGVKIKDISGASIRSNGNLYKAQAGAGSITVGDLGIHQDDQLFVRLTPTPVNGVAGPVLQTNIPTLFNTPPAGQYPVGQYVWGVSVENTKGFGDDGTSARIEIRCDNPGKDSQCTYGIRLGTYIFCSDPLNDAKVGKLKKDESITFEICSLS